MATNGIKKNFFLYAFVLLICGLGIYFSLERGQQLTPRAEPAEAAHSTNAALKPALAKPQSGLLAGFTTRLEEPLSRMFIQLVLIIMATRVMGALFRKIGQPAVVGEMFAGVLLGPSLFGWLFPAGFGHVFPAASLGTLKLMSQIGVCLFMFVVGMELNVGHIRTRAHTALLVSHTSIVFPYFLGVAVSLALFPAMAGPGVPFVSFALFLGISMSITAFPVLARILQERNLQGTWLGGMAITCAAIDDVTAWTILAFVMAIARASGVGSTLVTLLLVVAFVGLMLAVVKPRLPRWFGLDNTTPGEPGKGLMAAVLVLLFSAALATEVIGIHALFGAFLTGVVMPSQPGFRDYLKVRIENFSSIFLLPLFFAFTGLRTHLGLLNEPSHWLLCLLIVGVATLGKLGGGMVAARLTGVGWVDSFALGALMNTRGLMELIAINIGLDLGILSPEIFTMLVIMALFTTFMTGPLLTLADYWRRSAPAPKPAYP